MRFEAEGIPEETIDLILASWRSKIKVNYDSAQRKWQAWCSSENTYPFAADLSIILGFFSQRISGWQIVQIIELLVCRLLKGVFNLRPPLPCYNYTWDVTNVTSILQA